MNSQIIDIVHVVRRLVPVFELLIRMVMGITTPVSTTGTTHRV